MADVTDLVHWPELYKLDFAISLNGIKNTAASFCDRNSAATPKSELQDFAYTVFSSAAPQTPVVRRLTMRGTDLQVSLL
jgi:hypothetical protein